MFTDRVGFFALRDYPDGKPAGNVVDTFLKDLLAGALSNNAVEDRSQYVGIPAKGRFCLFYIEASDDQVHRAFAGRQDESARTNNYEFLYAYLMYERLRTPLRESMANRNRNL